MSLLKKENWKYSDDQIHSWEIGSKILIRRGVDGYFPAGERAYFEEIEKKGGITPENIRDIRNKAGDTIVSLLYQAGDSDIAGRIVNMETVGGSPLESYIGQLKWFFKGKGSVTIHEYTQAMRKTGNPNAHSINMKPLLHYLCERYFSLRNYGLMELIEKFLSLEWVDPNMLDGRDIPWSRHISGLKGKHIFDIFDTEERLLENKWVVLLLLEAWADGRLSTVWDVVYTENGSEWLLKKPSIESETESYAKRAIRTYNEHSQINVQ